MSLTYPPTAADGLGSQPATLRAYVRNAERYGGYDSVFEEAAHHLDPLDLAHLCMAMRSMSHELHLLRSAGKRKTVTETFKLGRDKREALTAALLREEKSSRTISDLLGCSTQCVREVQNRAEMGSESPGTSRSKARNRGRQGDCPSGTERGVVHVSGDQLYVSGSPGFYCARCWQQFASADAVYEHIEREHSREPVAV